MRQLKLNIRNGFLLLIIFLIGTFVVTLLSNVFIINRILTSGTYYESVQHSSFTFLELKNTKNDFFITYSQDYDFFATGKNLHQTKLISKHEELLAAVNQLRTSKNAEKFGIETDLEQLYELLQNYRTTFDQIAEKTREKGSSIYKTGHIGRFYDEIHRSLTLNTNPTISNYLNNITVISNDYLMTRDVRYSDMFFSTFNELDNYLKAYQVQTSLLDSMVIDSLIRRNKIKPVEQQLFLSVINVRDQFLAINAIDRELGSGADEGLMGKLNNTSNSIEKLIAKLDNTAVLQLPKQIQSTTLLSLFIVALLIAALIYYTYRFYLSIHKPIDGLKSYITPLETGVLPNDTFPTTNNTDINQVGQSLNTLILGIKETTRLASEISNAEFDSLYSPLGKSDKLGNCLLTMRDNLRKAKLEETERKIAEERRHWITQGTTQFNDILREYSGNLSELAYNVLKSMIDYLHANQGGLFIYNDDDPQDLHFELLTSFAYDRRKYRNKKILLGEGLIGACAQERKTIYLTEIPNEYIEISSGLGKTNPRSLLLVPLFDDKQVLGVIELASFNYFEEHEISFIEELADDISSTLQSAKVAQKTNMLLDQSRRQSEELAAQEEEMRQNMEELQATQEASARKDELSSGFVNAVNHSTIRADFNTDGTFDYANSKFLDIMQYSTDEIRGRHVSLLFNPADWHDFDEVWNRIINGGRHYEGELNITTKSGTSWQFATFTPMRDKDGNVFKILYLAYNIDTKKQQENEIQNLLQETTAKSQLLQEREIEVRKNYDTLKITQEELNQLKEEEALRTAELMKAIEANRETLIQIINHIPEKIFVKDEEGKFIIVNKAVAKAHAVPAEKLIGTSDFDHFKYEDALEYRKAEIEVIEGGKPVLYPEEIFKDYGGQVRILKTLKMPFFIPHLQQTGLLGIQFDITDVKEKEMRLGEQHKLLLEKEEEVRRNLNELLDTQKDLAKRNAELQTIQQQLVQEKYLLDALLNNIPDTIYFKDLQSRFIRVSKSVAELHKIDSPNDFIGKTDFDFFSEEHAQPAFNDEQRIIRSGRPMINVEEHEKWADGSDRWVSTTKMPLRDLNGNIIGTFGVTRDITYIKTIEIETRKKNEMLITAEEELRQNLEELVAIQEDMHSKNDDLEIIQKSLEWESTMFRTLMDALPSRVTFKDKDGHYKRINLAKAQRLKLDNPDDAIGKTDFDFFARDNAQKAWIEEQRLILSEQPLYDVEERLVWADGQYAWGATTRIPFRNKKGEIIGTLAITRDITDLKTSLANNQNKDKIIDQFLTSLPILIYKVSTGNAIIEIKGSGLNVLGLTETEIIGKHLLDLFPAVKDSIEKGLTANEVITFRQEGSNRKHKWMFEHYLFLSGVKEGEIIGCAFEVPVV